MLVAPGSTQGRSGTLEATLGRQRPVHVYPPACRFARFIVVRFIRPSNSADRRLICPIRPPVALAPSAAGTVRWHLPCWPPPRVKA